MTRFARWSALLALALATPLPAQDAPGEELFHELDRIARGALDEGALGIVLAIDVGGELLHAADQQHLPVPTEKLRACDLDLLEVRRRDHRR